MKLKLFSVYNKPYCRVEGCWVAPSAGLAIRDNSQFLNRVSPHFQEDLVLYEIGEFSDDGLSFSALGSPVSHSWDEYKHPEVPATPLTEEEKKSVQDFHSDR